MGKYHILESQQALFLFNFDIVLKRQIVLASVYKLLELGHEEQNIYQ